MWSDENNLSRKRSTTQFIYQRAFFYEKLQRSIANFFEIAFRAKGNSDEWSGLPLRQPQVYKGRRLG